MSQITIRINHQEFKANLVSNPTTERLKDLFPLTIRMEDLNRNEKYHYLNESLPSNPETVGKIKAGDIMLFGSDCIVLFYKSFTTSYQYTKIATIEGDLSFLSNQDSIDVSLSI